MGLSSVPSTSRKSLSTIQRRSRDASPSCQAPSGRVTALTPRPAARLPRAVQPARNRGPDAFRLNQGVAASTAVLPRAGRKPGEGGPSEAPSEAPRAQTVGPGGRLLRCGPSSRRKDAKREAGGPRGTLLGCRSFVLLLRVLRAEERSGGP